MKSGRAVERWQGLLIPLLAAVMGILACVGPQPMGTLGADAPVTFSLLGEVDHTWEAEVVPERRYTITVRRESQEHPADRIHIVVRDAAHRDANQSLAANPEFSEDTARVIFVAPASGQVEIVVYSMIGMQQENLGPHTLELSPAE